MSRRSPGLRSSAEPLTHAYDCAMLDLDGVVYRGREAVAGVPDVLAEVRKAGVTLAFVTNNAARTPAEVAHHLLEIGVEAHESDVVTSAQAAAAVLADRVPRGSRVLVVGGEGLILALRERGLVPVSSGADLPVAVVQGFHPTVGWTLLAEAAYAVSGGALWIASNIDLTVPTARGIAPGNGALVNAVAAAVKRRPDAVAGKPYRPLFDETVRRVSAERPLVIGDRLDTDIEGAVRCDADSLLVMTGVTDVPALCQAPAHQRPTYVSLTLDGLLAPHRAPGRDGGVWTLGGWTARVEAGRAELVERGSDQGDGLRVLAAACWGWVDEHRDGALVPDTLTGVLDRPGPAGQR
jgi:glycerol 3-phosphatase-2